MSKQDTFQLYFIDFDGRSDMTENLGQYDTFEQAQVHAIKHALREEWVNEDPIGLFIVRDMTSAMSWREEELGGFDAENNPFVFQRKSYDWGYAIFRGPAALLESSSVTCKCGRPVLEHDR